ncbi:hypothetical protein AB0K71_05800 [Streptomyces syringium]|uniref:hypothetical protein n=1 Tax=Streptomyces syringium TaxID=76729 RepID=UPI00341EBAF4
MPVPVPCPGPENNAWRRAEQGRAERNTEHELTPTWGHPLHCTRCAARARTELAELPELLAAVSLEATHASPGPRAGTIGRTSTEPPWPGQASRLLTDHIVGGLLALEDDIRDLRSLNPRTGPWREGATVTASARFLDTHLAWALEHHPLAGEPHDRLSGNPAAQIHGWHRAALRFTGRDTRVEHHRVPCPRCELLTLFRSDGDDYIECRNIACGALLTPAECAQRIKAVALIYAENAAA